jgi:hypothetical protein
VPELTAELLDLCVRLLRSPVAGLTSRLVAVWPVQKRLQTAMPTTKPTAEIDVA